MQTYTVQAGDTIYGISKQFGVSVDEIKNANNLSNNTIKVGQVLKIPTTETTALYIVKKGDSLYSIARNYNTTVSELMSINNLKTNILSIGQQIKVPVNSSNTTQTYIIYTVKKGDNLYSIANVYDTTVDSIKNLNNLTSNLLSIGQQLKIPTTQYIPEVPGAYEIYVVKKGDSLYKIAQMYNMSVEELIAINNLNSNVLTIGQELKVKKTGGLEPTEEECYGEGYKEPTYETYTVKKGDSLYTIAKKYNTSVDNLISLNNLTNSNLSIGQILKIKEII